MRSGLGSSAQIGMFIVGLAAFASCVNPFAVDTTPKGTGGSQASGSGGQSVG
jgi:hypothetical protein